MQASGERSVLVEVTLDILGFPLWWYSRGLILMLNWCGRTLAGYSRFMGIGVWVKNIFVPMFGQRDWQSRLISIFMRAMQIVFRSIALVFIGLGISLLFVVYLLAPGVVVGLIIWNLFGTSTYAAGI